MDIKEAKTEIKNTLRAYLLKDSQGKYRFPVVRQRPILLMGPPGIGKTAILQQAAREAGVGLVAYTLTHHTRQSAVGLPHIEKRNFCGETLSVTEYTMSEIIASVYTYMEKTGKREGILFLDEVNCVSETLAPTMLELLQNKTFGGHRVPEGWILVAAGNPPEYNKSVREFDVATLDRVRKVDVQPNCDVWLEYAADQQVHSAVRSYLSIRPDHFYMVEDQGDEKQFVTARGWEDLSELLKSYELLDVPVSAALVQEYLQQEEVAREFTAYYQLYRKYSEDYDITSVLAGKLSRDVLAHKAEMARNGGFEERFTVIRLLMEAMETDFRQWQQNSDSLQALQQALLRLKRNWGAGPGAMAKAMEESLQVRKSAGLLGEEKAEQEKWVIKSLKEMDLSLKKAHIWQEEPGFNEIRRLFSDKVEAFSDDSERLSGYLQRAFRFAEQCFGEEGQELTLLMTEISRNQEALHFIGENGSEDFLRHGEALAYRSQEKTLMEQCRSLLK